MTVSIRSFQRLRPEKLVFTPYYCRGFPSMSDFGRNCTILVEAAGLHNSFYSGGPAANWAGLRTAKTNSPGALDIVKLCIDLSEKRKSEELDDSSEDDRGKNVIKKS